MSLIKSSKFELSSGTEVVVPMSKTLFITIGFILAIVVSIYLTNFDINLLITNGGNFFKMLVKMIPTDFSEFVAYSKVVFPDVVDTIQMSIVGTVSGTIISFPIAFLAARNTNHNSISRTLIRVILSVTRTFPVIIYALILTYVFGLGEFAGVVAISIFTFGILTKMFYELIETVDMNPYESAIAAGSTSVKAFIVAIIPQIRQSFISIPLYTLEINVRNSTILAIVGAGGIGKKLMDNIQFTLYERAGIIVIWIMVVVMFIDFSSQAIRRRLN